MPIEGISGVRRLPRLGVIRLGEKRMKDGREYPAKLDYFNLRDAQALVPVFGAKPKSIEIALPHEDPEVFFPQFRKAYRTSGLFCKGTGVTASRVRLGLSDGEKTRVPKGQPYDPDGEKFIKEQGLTVKVGDRFELPCLGADCPFTVQKFCKPLGVFMFLVPKAGGFGCYQISTTSFNSMVDLNSYIDAVRNAAGRISMIPLTLSLVPKKVTVNGKATGIFHLKLEYKGSLKELMQYRDVKYIAADLLPQIEHETPGDLYAHGGEELDKKLGGAPAKPAAEPVPAEPESRPDPEPTYEERAPMDAEVVDEAPPLPPAKQPEPPAPPKKSPLAPPQTTKPTRRLI